MADDFQFDTETELELPEPDFSRFFPDTPKTAFGGAARLSESTRRFLEERLGRAGTAGDLARAKLLQQQELDRQAAERRRVELERKIRADLAQVEDPPGDTITAAEFTALDGITRELERAQISREEINRALVDSLVDLRNQTEAIGKVNTEAVTGELSRTADETKAELQELGGRLEQALDESTRSTTEALRDLPRKLAGELAQPLGEAARTAQRSQEQTLRGVEQALRRSETTSKQALGQLEARVVGSAQAAAATSESLLEKVSGLGSAFLGGAGEIVSGLGGKLDDLGSGLLGETWERLLELLGIDSEEGLPEVNEAARRIIRGLDPDSDVALEAYDSVLQELPAEGVLGGLARIFIAGAASLASLWAVSQLRGQRLAQEYNLTAPTALLPVPDLIDAWKRDLRTLADVLLDIRRQGYSQADAETAVALRRLIAAPSQLQAWRNRGLIGDDRFRREFEGLGYEQADVERFLETRFQPPPLGDIIRFAVREVFSPGARQALTLDEDYPLELTALAEEQGLTEKWAKAYWAAHWELPSVTQAFEMFHRGELTREELEGYMKAADLAPVWRDKMVAISYRPLSRVDLRRMYSLGELEEADLVRGYQDLGYSPVNAERLARFAVVERQTERARRESDLGELTPAQLRDAVSSGLILRDEAEQELEARGYSARAADVYLALTSKGTPET